MKLFNNMVIQSLVGDQEVFERILWISENREYVILIDMDEEKDTFPVGRGYEDIQLAIEVKRAQIVNYQTKAETMNLDLLPPESVKKNQARNQRAWEIIQELCTDEPDIYNPKLRGVLVSQACKKYGVSTPTINKYLKRYWRAGKNRNGIVMRYYESGGKGKEKIAKPGASKRGRKRKITDLHPEKVGINTDEDVHKIFMIAYEKFIVEEKLPINTAFIRMIRLFFAKLWIEEKGELKPVLPDQSELPEYNTFKYWVRKEQNKDPDEAARLLFNEKKYNLKFRPKVGSNTQMAPYPGSIFQIDATIGDIYLRSSYRHDLIIGKPVIYTVIDVCTHMFVGLYVGLEGPSYLGAMMAIHNTGSSKVDYCRRFGITITEEQWPCRHLPAQFFADRGELLSKNNVNITNGIGVDIEYAAPYRADMKPLVESYFNVLNKGAIHRLPGATSLKLRERGERDNRLDATLTLEEFTKLIIGLILKHNNHKYMENYPITQDMITQNVKPIPVHLWNWGIRKGGALRIEEETSLHRNLLPRDKARITERGILYKRVPYTCESAKNEGWFVRTNHPYRGKEVDIAVDPRNTSIIYIRTLTGFEPCTMINEDHHAANKAWEEFFHIQEVLAIEHEDKFKQEQLEEDVEFDQLVATTIAIGEMRLEDTEQAIRAQLKGIRENRREEKERNRAKESAVPHTPKDAYEEPLQHPVDPQQPQSASVVAPKSKPTNSRQEALRKAQEARKYKEGSDPA